MLIYVGLNVFEYAKKEYRWKQIVDESLLAAAKAGSGQTLSNECAEEICVSQIAFISKKDFLVTVRYSTKGGNLRIICWQERGGDALCGDFNARPDGVYDCFRYLTGKSGRLLVCFLPEIFE
jgi:hypothetical protein